MVAPLSNPAAPNPSKLMAQLRMMPDQQLVQYAQMHKNDPYIFPMAFQESNTRKQMRAAQYPQAAQAPKVVDQSLQEMAQPMPEDQGIATLPAPNMQNMAGGGIVAFDDGGEVPGYAEGVFTGVKKKYKELTGYEFDGGPEMFNKALDAEGVTDPKKRAFLKAIHDKESNQARVAPTRKVSGAAGPMQVTADAWTDVSKRGEELKNRNDSYDNMRAGIRYASIGWAKAKGDPMLASTYYYGGGGGFAKAQEGKGVAADEDKGQTTLQYGKDVAARYLKMLPSTTATAAPVVANAAIDQIPGQSVKAPPPKAALQDQGIASLGDPTTGFTMPQDVFSPSSEEERKYAAAQVQAKKVGDVVSQIPGQSVKAPAFKDTNTYFGGVADRMDIPLEVQRDIANTINATSGFTSPLGGVNRAASTVSKGLEPTAEMIQKAEQARQVADTVRLLPPAKAGLEGLDAASAAARAGAEQARRMRLLEQDRKAAIGAEQSIDAATKSAAIADKLAKEQAMLVDAARLGQAKMTGAAQGLAMTQAADKAGLFPQGGGVSDLVSNERIGESVFDPTFGGKMPLPVDKAAPEGITAAETPKDPVTGGTDWNRLMLQMGLHLMAGKSPNLLTNVGEAGLGALTMQQAEAKANSEKAYREAMAAHAKMPSSEVQMIERYSKDPTFRKAVDTMAAAKREPMTRETLFKEYIKSPVASIKPFSEYVSEYEKEFGPLGAGVPTGVIVSRAGQT
jgi:hypothetical protein